jgi:large subunit ribosomal protein L36
VDQVDVGAEVHYDALAVDLRARVGERVCGASGDHVQRKAQGDGGTFGVGPAFGRAHAHRHDHRRHGIRLSFVGNRETAYLVIDNGYQQEDAMKVRNSITSLKNQPGAQVVRRHGRVFVINKLNPRWKGRQG